MRLLGSLSLHFIIEEVALIGLLTGDNTQYLRNAVSSADYLTFEAKANLA